MTLLAIVEKGDPVLEQKALLVPLADIESKKIQTLITNMCQTLHAISDGVGLAAPQVGVPLQIFVVSRRIFEKKLKKDGGVLESKAEDLICINPRIIKASKTKKWMTGEGCLSVRWYYGKVYRSTNVSLEYYDQFGKKHIRGAGGLLSHIFQHECDHLQGELFIDKAKEVEWLEPEEEVSTQR